MQGGLFYRSLERMAMYPILPVPYKIPRTMPLPSRNIHMNLVTKIVLFGLFISPVSQAGESGGTETTASGPICETIGAFNDFDFWLGEWNVYSNDEDRTFQGTNSVTKHHQNCLIMENWTSASGGTGRSMNYYDPVEGHWRQLWVADGYSIDYSGGLDGSGAMVLSGKINDYKSGRSQAFRGTWTPNQDGSVRQFFEQQDSQSGAWKTWFDGLYIKQQPDQ
jgi:hypothetical protein